MSQYKVVQGLEYPRGIVHEIGSIIELTDEEVAGFDPNLIEKVEEPKVQNVGDVCTTEEGKTGTLQPSQAGFVCVANEEPVVPPTPVAEVPEAPGVLPTEPQKRYRGHVVIMESENTVGVQTFKHIRLDDGTEYDLTDVEYRTEVHVSYPPTA